MHHAVGGGVRLAECGCPVAKSLRSARELGSVVELRRREPSRHHAQAGRHRDGRGGNRSAPRSRLGGGDGLEELPEGQSEVARDL